MKSMANRIRFKKNYHPHFGAMNCFFFRETTEKKRKNYPSNSGTKFIIN